VIWYLLQRFTRFDQIPGTTVAPVEERLGNTLALQVPNLCEALNIVARWSTDASVAYEDCGKFARLVGHEGFAS
jgi:hypothetical protein